MRDAVRDAVSAQLGTEIRAVRSVGGGDINQAFEVELADGDSVFVKTNADAPRHMFQTEARGLEWLRAADAISIPNVLGVAAENDPAQYLILEYLASGQRVPNFEEELGAGLAALHRYGADQFGLDHDNFIGRLAQANTLEEDWLTFYRDRRLLPQIELAVANDRIGAELRRKFDRLFERLGDWVDEPEAPARLHGDLWGGNLHADREGHPCLIDPAVYGGHREMDIAMMKLFGGFGPRVFASYDRVFPLEPGWRDRVGLYQLYPLLVHVNLFGGSYVSQVDSAVSAYL